jgi:phosphopantetheine adenylyltransferase
MAIIMGHTAIIERRSHMFTSVSVQRINISNKNAIITPTKRYCDTKIILYSFP